MRVCFADDEPLARERMRKMLALDEDIEICGEAQNGEDMIALIQAEEPELVFLDIEMPKLDGFDVVEALAQATFRDEPPLFIFATKMKFLIVALHLPEHLVQLGPLLSDQVVDCLDLHCLIFVIVVRRKRQRGGGNLEVCETPCWIGHAHRHICA